MRINKRAIAQKMLKSRFVEDTAYRNQRDRFNRAKQRLISEFNNHPVTREIEGGVNSSNISNTLGGRGNLFTFIGFPANSTPIDRVRNILETGVLLTRAGKSLRDERVVVHFKVSVPENELRAATPMPWESGNSWLYDIERGISGFSNYVYGKFENNSRSGGGLQTDHNFGGAYIPTPYIRALLKQFFSRLNLQ